MTERERCAITGEPCSHHCTVWCKPCEDADAEDWSDQGSTWVLGWLLVGGVLALVAIAALRMLVPAY